MRARDVMIHHSGLRGQRETGALSRRPWFGPRGEQRKSGRETAQRGGGRWCKASCALKGPLSRVGLQRIGSACCGLSQALVTTQNGLRTAKNEHAAVWE